jgi:hypothetical protein
MPSMTFTLPREQLCDLVWAELMLRLASKSAFPTGDRQTLSQIRRAGSGTRLLE